MGSGKLLFAQTSYQQQVYVQSLSCAILQLPYLLCLSRVTYAEYICYLGSVTNWLQSLINQRNVMAAVTANSLTLR